MDTIKTIADAIELYKRDRLESVCAGYKEAIELIIKNKIEDPLKNDSYLDALYLTEMMFNKTNNQALILTSNGVDHFIEALGESFEKMLERIGKVGGKVKMIILDGSVNQLLSTLLLKFNHVLEIKPGETKDGAIVNHFIACDSNMIRVEKPHGKLDPTSDISSIKADVYFNNENETQRTISFFNAAWRIVS
jgi:hypothetical protein